MKVGLYARVSKANCHQDPEVQLNDLRAHCLAQGWSIAEEYVDHGWSGSKASRPELDRLMRDATRAHPGAQASTFSPLISSVASTWRNSLSCWPPKAIRTASTSSPVATGAPALARKPGNLGLEPGPPVSASNPYQKMRRGSAKSVTTRGSIRDCRHSFRC